MLVNGCNDEYTSFILRSICEQCRLRLGIAECDAWLGSPLIAYNQFSQYEKKKHANLPQYNPLKKREDLKLRFHSGHHEAVISL